MSDSRKERKSEERHSKNLFHWLITALIILILVMILGTAYYVLYGKGIPVKKEAKSTPTTTAISSSKKTATTTTSSEKKDETVLVKDRNYNEAIKDKIYSPEEVRKYFFGTEKFPKKTVFLTFDDGPNDVITPKVLDTLKQYQVPATFFVVGNQIGKGTKAILEREIKEGHAIALHSYSHNYDRLYPGRVGNANQIEKEAKDTLTLLKDQLGEDFNTNVWRYPGGHMSWQGLSGGDAKLKALGLEWMDWNAAVGDAESLPQQPKTVAEMIQKTATSLTEFPDNNVHVVLMHDAPDKKLTAESLPKVIEFFKEKGYEFAAFGKKVNE